MVDSGGIKDIPYSWFADEYSCTQTLTTLDIDYILITTWIYLEDTASDDNQFLE